MLFFWPRNLKKHLCRIVFVYTTVYLLYTTSKKELSIFMPYHIYHSEKLYLEYEKLLYKIYQKIKGETFDLENVQFDKLGQLGWKL